MTPCVSSLILCLALADAPTAKAGSAVADASVGLALAAGVARWASENMDSDAMMVAAELVSVYALGGLSGAKGDDELGLNALFERAAAFAVDGRTRARLEQRRSVDPRGIARALGDTGPIGRLMLIDPDRPLTFLLTARGSEQALLHVGPTAGGDLDVLVVDDKGGAVCEVRAPGRPVLCNWRPPFTTTYQVIIRSRSAAPITTVITSN